MVSSRVIYAVSCWQRRATLAIAALVPSAGHAGPPGRNRAAVAGKAPVPSTRPTRSTTAATCTSAWVPAPPVTGMACSAILDTTSPSPSCQCLVAGKGTPPGPGACGQNTSRTPKVRLLPGHGRPRPGGSRPPASPGPAVRRQDTRSTVSSAQGQDQDQRQDTASLREGRCGSPEDNPVNNPVSEPPPTMVE